MKIGSSTDNQNNTAGNGDVETGDLEHEAGSQSGAESSTAQQDDNKPKDIESAVRRALDGDKVGQSSSSGDNSVSGQAADPSKAAAPNAQKPAEEDSDLTEAELNSLKPRTRRSFERMRGQIESLTAQVGEKTTEAETNKFAAQKLANIQGYCDEYGLTKDDVNTGFNIMGLMKSNPKEALKELTPVFESLKALCGEVLPRDLQEQIVKGEISPERAQEISRLRAENALNSRRMTEREDRQRETELKDSVKQSADAAGNAVSDLEKQWAASDPDYRLKSTRITERIELELLKAAQAKKLPRNAQEAVDLATRVKKEVDGEFKRFLPQKRAVQTVVGVQTSTGSKPAPKSTKEAIWQAIGQ